MCTFEMVFIAVRPVYPLLHMPNMVRCESFVSSSWLYVNCTSASWCPGCIHNVSNFGILPRTSARPVLPPASLRSTAVMDGGSFPILEVYREWLQNRVNNKHVVLLDVFTCVADL